MVIKMKYEKVLIQTEEVSIVFGEFKGEKDQGAVPVSERA